jgi:hypothetical protein
MDKEIYNLFSLNAPGEIETKSTQIDSGLDLYNLSFDITPSNDTDTESPLGFDENVEATYEPKSDIPTPAMIKSRIALASTSMKLTETYAPEIEPTEITKFGLEIEQEQIPDRIRNLAHNAVTHVLEINKKPRIRTAQFADNAFKNARRESPETFYLFKQALRYDDRLTFVGDGEFEVNDRAINSSDAWINSWQPDLSELEAIKETIIQKAFRKELPEHVITTIARDEGHYLLDEEVDVLLSILASDSRFTIDEDGTLILRKLAKDASDQRQDRALSPRQISYTMKKMHSTREFREMRETATNKANTRKKGKNRRKKGSRMMGKQHGKKKTIEQLIQEMNQKNK